MRLFFAILLCKLVRLALRLAGRGGTALPGKIALRVCPDMLSRLARGVTTVMVTGTNGKTTTCRMLEQMARDAGRDCFANRSGSNLERGIAADFAANADRIAFQSGTGPYVGDFMEEHDGLWMVPRDEGTWRKVIEVVESGGDPTTVVALPEVEAA